MKAVNSLVLLLLISTPIFPQTKVEGAPNLQLTTKILQQRYCDSGYPDMALMKLSLQLTFNNASQQPLIIYRGIGLPNYVLVSLDEENARNKKYELNQHIGWVTSGEPRLNEGSKPGPAFVVLSPGESYQTEANVSIGIGREPDRKYLRPGKYSLEIVAGSFPGDETEFQRLKNRWIRTGFLWGSSVKSQPMSIEVEKEPKIVACR